jgi:hypothetical protein
MVLKRLAVLVAGDAGAWGTCAANAVASPFRPSSPESTATGKFTRTGNLSQGRFSQTTALLTGAQLLPQDGAGPNSTFVKSSEFYVPLRLSISSYSLISGVILPQVTLRINEMRKGRVSLFPGAGPEEGSS